MRLPNGQVLKCIRFSEEGCLRERGADYTLYWSGKSPDERRLSGVGFKIRDSIATTLTSLPIGHPDRIISMRLPLSVQQHATLFSVYTPNLQVDFAEREYFYTDLSSVLRNVPANDMIVVQWSHTTWTMRWTTTVYHQHCLPTQWQFKNHRDASSINTLAHDRLYPCASTWPKRCSSYQSDA